MAPAGLKTGGRDSAAVNRYSHLCRRRVFPCRARIMAEDFVPAVYAFERFLRSLLKGLHRCRKAA